MMNLEDLAKFERMLNGMRERTLSRIEELKIKFPNETFPSKEEIEEYSPAKMMKYHLKITERLSEYKV